MDISSHYSEAISNMKYHFHRQYEHVKPYIALLSQHQSIFLSNFIGFTSIPLCHIFNSYQIQSQYLFRNKLHPLIPSSIILGALSKTTSYSLMLIYYPQLRQWIDKQIPLVYSLTSLSHFSSCMILSTMYSMISHPLDCLNHRVIIKPLLHSSLEISYLKQIYHRISWSMFRNGIYFNFYLFYFYDIQKAFEFKDYYETFRLILENSVFVGLFLTPFDSIRCHVLANPYFKDTFPRKNFYSSIVDGILHIYASQIVCSGFFNGIYWNIAKMISLHLTTLFTFQFIYKQLIHGDDKILENPVKLTRKDRELKLSELFRKQNSKAE